MSFAIAGCIVQTDKNLGDQSGPTCLMAGAAATPGIAVEILEKRNEVFPVRIVVKHLRITEHGPFAACIAKENAGNTMRQFAGHLLQRFHLPRAGRALDLETAAVVTMVFSECLDDQEVDRKPNRPAPVRVAAK